MKFKIGDRVKINSSSCFYQENTTVNPKCSGKIYNIVNSHSLSIKVQWDNNKQNCYNDTDLTLALPIIEIY